MSRLIISVRILMVILLLMWKVNLIAQDNNGNGVDDANENALAERFAPILRYHQGNPLFPMSVNDIYDESDFSGLQPGDYAPLPLVEYGLSHTPDGWQTYFETVLAPQNLIPTVYYNIITQEVESHEGTYTTYFIIQYWFYYPFNDAANLHEGEWEHVSVITNSQNPTSATPLFAAFHHHYLIDKYPWDQVETEPGNSDHMYTYVGGKADVTLLGIGHLSRENCNGNIIGGYAECTGASFPNDGYQEKSAKLFGPCLMNERITSDREVHYSSYDLINLRQGNIFWLDNNVYFGSSGVVIGDLVSSYICTYNIDLGLMTFTVEFPQTMDPPKNPKFSEWWDMYPLGNSSGYVSFPYNGLGDHLIGYKFDLLESSRVFVKLWSDAGNLITTLVNNEIVDGGSHRFEFDPEDYLVFGMWLLTVEVSPGNLIQNSFKPFYLSRHRPISFWNLYSEGPYPYPLNAGGTLTCDAPNVGTVSSGSTKELYDIFEYTVTTDDHIFENWNNQGINIKHHDWNTNLAEFRYSKEFIAEEGDQHANYQILNNVWLTSNGDVNIEIHDPWFMDESGQQPGNAYIPVNGQYQVFLDQGGPDYNNLQPPYYRLRAPRAGWSTGEEIYAFKAWRAYEPDGVTPDVNGNYAVFDDSTNYHSCAVVFKAEGTVVKAIYEAVNQIPGYTLTVNSNEILTIPAGADIAFAEGFTLDIRGELVVNGTPSFPVHLTGSGRETVFENGDNLRPADPLDTLIVISDSAGEVTMTNTVIENTYCALSVKDNYNPNLTLQNVEISHTNIGILIGKTVGDPSNNSPGLIFSGVNIHDSHNGIVFGPGLADTAQTTELWLQRATIWNIEDYGLFIYQEEPIVVGISSILNLYIINNTFYKNDHYGIYCSNGASNDWGMVNVLIYNNILVGSAAAYTSNNVTMNSETNLSDNGANVPPNTIVADPLLAAPEQGDFHLTASSPAINYGTGYIDPSGLPYFTDPDNTQPDLGAYYFDAVPGVPAGFDVTGVIGGHPHLQWILNPEPDIDRYEIFRLLTDHGSEFVLKAIVNSTTAQYEDTEIYIAEGNKFNPQACYRIRAVDGIEQASNFTLPLCKPYGAVGKTMVGNNLPEEYSLSENIPNPFNPVTSIQYGLPENSRVELVVYDLMGRVVRTLASGKVDAGYQKVNWEGITDKGMQVSSGMYLYKLTAVSLESEKIYTKTGKMALLR